MATTIFTNRCYEQAIELMQATGLNAVERDIHISSAQHHGFIVQTRKLLFSTTEVVTDLRGLNSASKNEVLTSTQFYEPNKQDQVNYVRKIIFTLHSYTGGIYLLTFRVFIKGELLSPIKEKVEILDHKPPTPPRGPFPSSEFTSAAQIPYGKAQSGFPDLIDKGETVRGKAQMGLPEMLGFGDFREASSAMKNLAERVQGSIVPDMEVSAESLKKLFASMSEMIETNKGVDMTAGARDALRDIGNLDQKISNQLYKATSMIFFVSALTYWMTSEDTKKDIILGISIACLIIFWFDRLSEIMVKIVDIMGLGGPKAQDGLGHEGLLTGLVTMMMGLSLKSGSAGKMSDKVMKHLGGFDRIKNSLGGIIKFMTELVTYCFEKANLEHLLPDSFKYLCITEDKVMEIVKKVDKIKADLKAGEYLITRENLTELHEIREVLLNIQLKTPNLPATRGTLTTIHDELRELQKIIDTFDASFMSSIRQEPVSILIKGGPGTLKSQIVKRMGLALVTLTIDDKKLDQDPDKHIYIRAVENEYWDGYRNQLVTILDDFGQFKEVAGNLDGEAANLIRMYNELAAPLHMAPVEEKGKCFFTSLYVAMTTNLELFEFDSVRDSGAIRRRFDIVAVPSPKKEYVSEESKHNVPHHRVIDFSKLPLGVDNVSSVDPQVAIDFHLYNIKTGTYTGEVIDFDKLIMRAYRLQCEKNKWFKQQEFELLGVRELYKKKREQQSEPYIEQLKREEAKEVKEVIQEMEEVFYDTESEIDGFDHTGLMDRWLGGKAKAQGNFGDIHSEKKKLMQEKAKAIFSRNPSILSPNVEIINDDVQSILDSLYLGEEEESPIRCYLDTASKVLGMNCKFNLLSRNFRLWLLCKNDPYRFVDAVTTCDEDYLDSIFRISEHLPIIGPCLKVDFKRSSFYQHMVKFYETLKEYVFTPLYDGFIKAIEWLKQPHVAIGIACLLGFISYFGLVGAFIGRRVGQSIDKGVVDDKGNPVRTKWHDAYLQEKAKRAGDPNWEENPKLLSEEEYAKIYADVLELKKKGGDIEIEMVKENPKVIPEGAYNMKEHKVVARVVRPKHQMGYAADASGCQQVDKYLRTNMYEMLFDDKHIGFVTFLDGYIAVCNYHFYAHYKKLVSNKPESKDYVIKFERLTKGDPSISRFSMTVNDFINACRPTANMTDKDLILFMVKDHHPHRNCMDLFPTYAQLKDMRACGARLIHKGNEGITSHVTKAEPLNHFEVMFDGTNYDIVRDGFTYNALTEEGDCGAWLQVLDPRSTYKVVGIHVAGDQHVYQGKNGYSTGIFKELLEEGLLEFPERLKQAFPNVALPQINEVIVGRFDEAYTASVPNRSAYKSQIMPSPLYDVITIHKEKPCHLRAFTTSDGERIDPFQIALTKYCKAPILLHNDTRSAIKGSLIDFLKGASDVKYVKGLLTFEEAVLGLPDEDYFKAIPRSTSAGYPLNTEQKAGFSGKQRFFGKDTLYDLTRIECQVLKKECFRVIEELRKGNRQEFIFADNLKDETKPIEKVEQGKTRLFNSCPLVYLIIWRMYFGNFSLWYTKNMIHNGSAIGMCPYGEHWNVLARCFNKFKGGDSDVFVGAGDYSAFDASERIAILNDIRDVIETIIDDPSTKFVREMLWTEIINSFHIKGASVYCWVGSLPSGHPFTTIINCLYNHYAFRYCWFRANNNDILALWKFHSYVYLIVMGDDNAFAVHPAFREVFNEVTIEPFMAEIGLVYTNDLKVVSKIPLRKLEEITFMKRSFRFEETLGRYVAPLVLDSVFETLNWVKKAANYEELTMDKVNLAIDELSLHGPEVFDQHVKKISEASGNILDMHPASTYYMEALPRVCQRTSFFG